MTGPSSPEPPCWSNPDPPSLSWTELVQPPASEWAAYFPDIARFEPKALRFVPGTGGDIEGIYRGRQLKLSCSDNEMMVCPICLVRCGALRLDLPWVQNGHIIYYGCRACGQSQEFLKIGEQITAILDHRMTGLHSWDHSIFHINWLAHRRWCDFDKVEIVQATDEEVERFVVQLGNDTDLVRRAQYSQIPCIVVTRCGLSENTMRILRWMFEQVEVKEIATEGSSQTKPLPRIGPGIVSVK